LLTIKEHFDFVGRSQIVKNSLGNIRKVSGESRDSLIYCRKKEKEKQVVALQKLNILFFGWISGRNQMMYV